MNSLTNLQSLKEFQILLQQNEIINYFYCNKLLKNSIHVDHFIPWSQNYLLWNFVLACPSCNTNKNDKLAIEIYLENLITRNEQLKSIESLHKQFEDYNSSKLEKLYGAKNNGLIWDWAPSIIY